jgi:hypothetical protein
MKLSHCIFVTLFSGASLLASCAAPQNPRVKEGPNRLYGKVIGPDGAMLDGVRITTEPQTDAVLTFEGEYEIMRSLRAKQAIAPGKYQMLPYKLGWWRGKGTPAISVDFTGGQYNVPDIQLIPIEGPVIDDLGAPEDRTDDSETRAPGVVRGGE